MLSCFARLAAAAGAVFVAFAAASAARFVALAAVLLLMLYEYCVHVLCVAWHMPRARAQLMLHDEKMPHLSASKEGVLPEHAPTGRCMAG